ncbi:hypothetical protein Q5H92_05335 [Hymenobacter sp. M29]|uniref:Uncharacterized protein n=1 Tax=Hymenobacter mellowenesis TaxID=3063995 RepID=A0ABT9A7F2_9BACT|nr:hypothetical protein [Hymenobacter sp. M29]MDO7845772.1 hypothetical protein [Hymenobacter sp. M29]
MEAVVAEFELYVQFERQSQTPQRVFKAIADLVTAFTKFDELLAQSILPELHAELILDDVEAGSIRSKLAILVRGIPDEAIQGFDWKKLVGHFLLKAKYQLLKLLEGKTGFTDAQEIENLRIALESMAPTETFNPLMVPGQLSTLKLVGLMEDIVRAAALLRPGDYADYRSSVGNARLNPGFDTSNLRALLATSTETSENEYLVKIKRPDFMGEAMWELVLKNHTIPAKMADTAWLEEFHQGRVDVRPNDYLSIRLRTDTTFQGNFGNPQLHYTVLKVLGVKRF